jgi:hypothetical protein
MGADTREGQRILAHDREHPVGVNRRDIAGNRSQPTS